MSNHEDAEYLDKRLIISGITPAVTATEIQQRLSMFGKVKSVDGIGLLDGLGQPRKFGFVSLETTQPKLARCMNMLNGTIWKGAKLRIGEARPDYKQRIEQELDPSTKPPVIVNKQKAVREAQKLKRIAKRKRKLRNREAGDMRPTTLENVQHRKGWKRTALNHLIRPIKMRPLHPLARTAGTLSSRATSQNLAKLQRRKLLTPPTRARVTLIDPTRYGSIHLTSASGLLGAEFVGYEAPQSVKIQQDELNNDSATSSEDENRQQDIVGESMVLAQSGEVATGSPHTQEEVEVLSELPPHHPEPEAMELDPVEDLAVEKSKHLSILDSLFSSDDACKLQWEADSDLEKDVEAVRIEEERLQAAANKLYSPPKRTDNQVKGGSIPDEAEDTEETEDSSSSASSQTGAADVPSLPSKAEETIEVTERSSQVQVKSLKELFAPREEEEGFALFSNLNIDDDELDEEMAPAPTAPAPAVQQPEVTNTAIQTLEVNFDPLIPMFFLLPRDPTTGQVDSAWGGGTTRKGGRPKDMLDVFDEAGPDTFWKTETDDEIRKHWDEVKGDLTQEYRKRHREALKRKRRGFGGNGENEDPHR